jgi:hypothetical protein
LLLGGYYISTYGLFAKMKRPDLPVGNFLMPGMPPKRGSEERLNVRGDHEGMNTILPAGRHMLWSTGARKSGEKMQDQKDKGEPFRRSP